MADICTLLRPDTHTCTPDHTLGCLEEHGSSGACLDAQLLEVYGYSRGAHGLKGAAAAALAVAPLQRSCYELARMLYICYQRIKRAHRELTDTADPSTASMHALRL